MDEVKGIRIVSLTGEKEYGIEDSEVREELANVVDGAPEELDSFKEAFEKFKEGGEALAALAADIAAVGKAVADETTRAQSAENANADAIAAETSRAQAAENANADAIAAEISRAQAAEIANADAIAAEISRAQAAEIANADAIAAEISRAKTAEKNIESNALQYNALGVSVFADKAEIYGGSIDGKPRTVDIPAATTEMAGVMSADDKRRINYMYHAPSTVVFEDETAVVSNSNFYREEVLRTHGGVVDIDEELLILN